MKEKFNTKHLQRTMNSQQPIVKGAVAWAKEGMYMSLLKDQLESKGDLTQQELEAFRA